MPDDISLKNEILRKLIHFGAGIIPMIIMIYGLESIISYLCILTMLFVSIDYLKSRIYWISRLFNYFFHSIIRHNEFNNITGASWVLLSNVFIFSLFPLNIALYSIFILCISDSVAAIIGRIKGKTKIFNKSLQGSMSFLLSGLIISAFFSSIMLPVRIISVIIATFMELISFKINDNIIIPISVASSCMIGEMIF